MTCHNIIIVVLGLGVVFPDFILLFPSMMVK